MRAISWDLESHLIKKGQSVPKMVCLSWAERNIRPSEIVFYKGDADCSQPIARGLMLRHDALDKLYAWLGDNDVTIVGHNVTFDLAVAAAEAYDLGDPDFLRQIVAKYDKGLIHDTQTRQKLIDIAMGELKFHVDEETGDVEKTTYFLSDLAMRLLKKFLRKKDTWRLKYALLDGVPLAEWPEEAKKYAIDDSVTTLEIYEKQDEVAGGPIPNSLEQHRADFALHLMSVWGVRTDGEMVAKLKADLVKDFHTFTEKLRPSGLLKFTPSRVISRGVRKGQVEPEQISKCTKAIQERVKVAFEAKNLETPKTDPSDKFPEGQISTAKATLLETGDPELKLVAERGAVAKLVETYVPILESGTVVPINARYNVLVETGRTSCSKPNLQNPPRGGGVRQCFIPRDGWAFAFSDYDTLELRSLAQCCLDMLGRSEMAEALRRDEDLHLSFAADLVGKSYAEAKALYEAGDNQIKEDRQFCKIANFGFPGGLGAKSFVDYAAGYGTTVTEEKAAELRANWFKRWTEMEEYFGLISDLTENGGPIRQNRSGRVRGGASFCAAANGFFQGLAADGAKHALWLVTKECYVDNSSPLFGCRPVLFIHDELCLEIPVRWWGLKRSAAAAQRLSDVMIAAMKEWIPDVPIKAKPVMARRWFKGVEQVKVDGVLVPVRPETVVKADGKKKTVWVADVDGFAMEPGIPTEAAA